jgi:hypothetical protein
MARYYRRSNRKAIVNRYATTCTYCGATVEAGQGKVWKFRGRWIGAHHKGDCDPAARIQHAASKAAAAAGVPAEDRVVVFHFASGATVTQNSRGRCEDAPCCGCCS